MARLVDFSASTTLKDIIAARRNDQAVIDSLLVGAWTDMTGKRAVPVAVADDDKVRTFLVSGNDLWLFHEPSGVRTWMKFTADAVIT